MNKGKKGEEGKGTAEMEQEKDLFEVPDEEDNRDVIDDNEDNAD